MYVQLTSHTFLTLQRKKTTETMYNADSQGLIGTLLGVNSDLYAPGCKIYIKCTIDQST